MGFVQNPQRAAGVIIKPLLMGFEQSGEPREVPADWKLGNVVPIFKKEDPGNCRPNKIMEKIALGGSGNTWRTMQPWGTASTAP